MPNTPALPQARCLIVYHSKCMDGCFSAYLFKKYYPFSDPARLGTRSVAMRVISCNPQPDLAKDNKEDFEWATHIYFVDLCPSIDSLSSLNTKEVVEIYDHHISAYTQISKLPSKVISRKQVFYVIEGHAITSTPEHYPNVSYTYCDPIICLSGCGLIWELFFPEEADIVKKDCGVMEYINDRDLWRFKLYNSKEINTALREKLDTSSFDSFVQSYSEMDFDEGDLATIGSSLCLYTKKIIASLMKSAMQVTFEGFGSAPSFACPGILSSEAGEQMYSDASFMQGLKFTATYSQIMKENKLHNVWSFRSLKGTDSFDVSVMAQHFGGGGHKNAAGCMLLADDPRVTFSARPKV